MAKGRKKFLGDFKTINFSLPENWIPVFEGLKKSDPKMNNQKIIRTALENYFSSLPELKKVKKAS